MTDEPIVVIHGSPWAWADLHDAVFECRRQQWVSEAWAPSPALVLRTGGEVIQYTGQAFDPARYELRPTGWTHDHCQVCWWELGPSEDPDHQYGYSSQLGWLCRECYVRFIEPEERRHKNTEPANERGKAEET